MSSMDTTDILIIGGGPAGLQAALTAARVHRQAVILDDGRYRNASVAHMHNVIGADGNPPHQFRARVRDELTAYDTVSVRPVSATAVRSDPGGGFVADLSDGTGLSAGTVILATGVSDELPEIPGLAEVWGGRAAHCPFCHAHEFAGGRIGIIGTARAGHLGALLAPVAGSLLVLPLEGDSAEGPDGVRVAGSHVVGMRDTGSALDLTLADGSVETVDVAFVPTTLRQRSTIAEQLGLELNESGCVRVDELQRTSVPGVLAAGDMAHVPALPMPMASMATALASGQLAASAAIMHVLSKTH